MGEEGGQVKFQPYKKVGQEKRLSPAEWPS